MAIADQLNQAKNNALGTTNVGALSGTQSYTAPQLNTTQYDTSNLGSNLGAINNMKLTANNPTKLMANSPTVYASGTDLANAKNVYGNTVNYGDVNNPNLRPGDKIIGGSAVTPNITDDMLSKAGAQRLSGNDANGTLGAMQTDSKTTLPQYYQNTNNQALANTNYQNLSPNIDTSGYKNQVSNALNNAANYHYTQSNNVGMDNTPYANAINNSMNNSNSQASSYQNAIQQALNAYNSSSSTSGTPSAQDIYNNSKSSDEYYSDMAKYYPEQLKQIKALQQSAASSAAAGQDYSGIKQQYQGVLDSGKGQQSVSTTAADGTPQSNDDYIKNMTDKINSLYNTQRDNASLYYEPGKKQAAQQYQGLRNQASVTDQQNLNKLKESMAQQGLFNSGDNITGQTGINNEYAGNLAGYNQQEQNYYDNVNNQIAQQKAQYDTQQAQAMMDMYNNADSRSFKLANLNSDQKQQAFQNAMTGINAQYGMGQDQFGNTLKGTSATYGMGRDNVSDQMYNNDSQMKADQINYGRDQDYFNNQLKSIAQQYGMDEDQVNNLLKYAQFNSSEDQRQYQNSTGTNKANSDLTQAQTDNSYRQGQADTSNNQFNQTLDFQKQQQATNDSHWQQQFDLQQQAAALAQARAAASGSSGGGGGRRSSGGSSRSSGKTYSSSNSSGSGLDAAQSILNAARKLGGVFSKIN